jgi:hypothetical protein
MRASSMPRPSSELIRTNNGERINLNQNFFWGELDLNLDRQGQKLLYLMPLTTQPPLTGLIYVFLIKVAERIKIDCAKNDSKTVLLCFFCPAGLGITTLVIML